MELCAYRKYFSSCNYIAVSLFDFGLTVQFMFLVFYLFLTCIDLKINKYINHNITKLKVIYDNQNDIT